MILNRLFRPIVVPRRRKRYLADYDRAAPGTAAWLVGTELKFGGIVSGVLRNKVSEHDPRTPETLRTGGMIGGDRMLHHGYAEKYAEYLQPFVGRDEPVTLAEFGILKGTGLAIWCDLFPEGRVLGLDIDLGHIKGNLGELERRGAFVHNRPELHEFDQFVDNGAFLGEILGGDRIDVCIDDGFHSVESIMTTMKSVLPYLAGEFVYFVEDNWRVHRQIRRTFPDLGVESAGELTVVYRRDR